MFRFRRTSSLIANRTGTFAPIAPIAPKLIWLNTEVWDVVKTVNKCTVVLRSENHARRV